MQQSKTTAVHEYYDHFKNVVAVAIATGCTIGDHEGLRDYLLRSSTPPRRYQDLDDDEKVELLLQTQECFLGTLFLLNADRSRFGSLIENTENAFLQGRNNYPTSLDASYALLSNWKCDPRMLVQVVGAASDDMAFANIEDEACGGSDTGKQWHREGPKGQEQHNLLQVQKERALCG
jgi:hypothetical protein